MIKKILITLAVVFIILYYLQVIIIVPQSSGGYIFLLGDLNAIAGYLMQQIGPMLVPIMQVLGSLISQIMMLLSLVTFTLTNILLILFALFIISFFLEKFRSINNSINILNKKLDKHLTSVSNNLEIKSDQDSINNEAREQINNVTKEHIADLIKQARVIEQILTQIKSASDSLKPAKLRSKTVRRLDVTDSSSTEAREEEISEEPDNKSSTSLDKDEEQLMKLRKDNTLQENKVDVVSELSDDAITHKNLAKDEEQLMRLRKDQPATTDEILADDNISKIDLARTMIETGEHDQAREILTQIVSSGTEEEKHEAKLLYMQVKK